MPSVRSQVLAVIVAIAAVLGAASPAQAARPLKVVQLGDSYSAGNGAGDYYGPKDCYRSSTNWAERYMDTLRDEYNVTFVNRACSGGVISDLTQSRRMDDKTVNVFVPEQQVDKDDPGARELLRQRGGCTPGYRDDENYTVVPESAFPESGGTLISYACVRYMEPQIDAVGRDTDLVVFTIGGNDVKFADIIKQCFALGFRDPGDCRDKIDAGLAGIGDVGVRTAAFLRTLKARMRPDAHIILVSYPYLEKDAGLTLRGGFLFLDNYAVGSEIRRLGDLGDAGQLAAMKAVNAEGGTPVTYINTVKSAFAGHEPDGRVCCRNADRWVHEFDTFTPSEWYHFNPTGHGEIAKLLVQHPEFVSSTRDVEVEGAVDIAFVIDTTGSMGSSIDSVKDAATQLVRDVSARTSGARFALVDYRDFPERTDDPADYPAKLDQDFTSDSPTITNAIRGLSLGYGGDTPETMYSGLMRAFDLSWRPGVKKLAIVLADAPPLSPEPISGLTAQAVIDRSLAIDPVATHVVDVSGDAQNAAVDEIVSRTGGAVHNSSPSQAATTIAGVIDASLNRPSAWAGGPYVAKVGSTLILDGRGSYGVTSNIATWEWDFDSDGTYDLTSDKPTVSRTFTALYDGIVTLRVTDAGGGSSIATAVTHITRDGDEVADAIDTCVDVANPDQTDYDKDGLGDPCDTTPGYPDQDKPGVFDSGTPRAASAPGTTAPGTTPPGTTTPSAAKAPLVLPAANVRIARPTLVRRGAAMRMTVTCLRKSGTCTGVVRVQAGGRRVTRAYTVKAGRSRALTLVLPKGARTGLRRGKRVTFVIAATTKEGITAKRTVRMKLPGRR